jgi:hypothetical protein
MAKFWKAAYPYGSEAAMSLDIHIQIFFHQLIFFISHAIKPFPIIYSNSDPFFVLILAMSLKVPTALREGSG